jgi:4-hydroxybenzoate polyprenyltransferase
MRLLPSSLTPYASLGRWDRPIGTWLLLWPCMWSTALAAPNGMAPDVPLLALFGVGAFAMRGAGCTINDLWDRDIDRQVERTASRPLASGAISVPEALGFLGVQLSAGLGVLLALPPYAVGLGFCSVPLFTLYPLAKRFTNWPQLVLGLTFNWGALMGWAAVHGSCEWGAVLPLYAGGIWWTLLYDTVYAHQDKTDDARVGVRSTALALGDDRRPLALFGACCVGSLVVAGSASGLHGAYYMGVGAAAAHLSWQVSTVNLSSPADCLRKFQSNSACGGLIFLAIVAGKLLLEREVDEEAGACTEAEEAGGAGGSGVSGRAHVRQEQRGSAPVESNE